MTANDRELEALRRRVETLEAQIAFLFRSLGLTNRDAPEAQVSETVTALVEAGDTKGAIRAFRAETGASLKDAKRIIDALM